MNDFRRPSRRTLLVAAAVATLALETTGLVSAKAYAQGSSVRLILPNAAGSGVDAVARAMQPALAKALNSSVVVDNQPGAAGVVGLQVLARSAPDGNTLSMVSSNVVIFPSLIKSLSFDMPGDFTPIAIIGAVPMVLVVNANKVAATNSKELIALLKSKPGALNFASGGTGTTLHLATQWFLEEAGVSAKHIPYKGVGPMVSDLLGGQVEFGTAALPSVQPYIKSGALRAIGMLAAQRTTAAPEIPTFAEQGLPNLMMDAWVAVIGPKNMNAALVTKIHGALVAAFEDPGVKEAMTKQGNIIAISTPEQAKAQFRSELAKYATLVRKAGIEPQ